MMTAPPLTQPMHIPEAGESSAVRAHALRESARRRMDESERLLNRLRSLRPWLVDITLRENAVSSPTGQSLADKLVLFERLREFGFRDLIVGCLDGAWPEEPQVDDDFMRHLRDHDIDRTGCFALTDVGRVDGEGAFQPSVSMQKLVLFGVPHTFLEVYLTDEGMAGRYDWPALQRHLAASVDWLHTHAGTGKGSTRIVVNVVDGCDAFAENLDRTCNALIALAALPIEGVSFEEERGTFLPFQVGAFVAIAREHLLPHQRLLIHVHGGAGLENAVVVEALLNGADGVWGGLTKGAGADGHASLGELIANLVRVGNPHMHDYRLQQLLPLAAEIRQRDAAAATLDAAPVLGRDAYRLSLDFFRHRAGRAQDLPPEAIGGRYRYRICPVLSDPAVIAGRLAEVTGALASTFDARVLREMVLLMRRDLRQGLMTVHDEPPQLMALYRRARQAVSTSVRPSVSLPDNPA